MLTLIMLENALSSLFVVLFIIYFSMLIFGDRFKNAKTIYTINILTNITLIILSALRIVLPTSFLVKVFSVLVLLYFAPQVKKMIDNNPY